MRKTILTMVTVMLMLCSSAHAAGLTVWGLTEQATSVNNDNSITGRLGYFLGIDDNGPGLEPFIGSVWRPKDEAPQVITVGAVQHLRDIIDPDSVIPLLPNMFLAVISEEVIIRPYFGGQCTINFVDRDAGFIGALAGTTIKIEPKSPNELVLELSYDAMFGDLAGVPDHEFKGYLGFRIWFPKD